jgi:hypothetical protein
MKNNNEINYVGISVNIARAYEIAKLGNHTVSFAHFKDTTDSLYVTPDYIETLAKFYSLEPHPNGQIIIEVLKPEAKDVERARTRQFETLAQIDERIEVAKTFPRPGIDTVSDGSKSLLNTAYDRLGLSPQDTDTIYSVAQTIAQLVHSSTLKVEHIAEAIQYRAMNDEQAAIYKRIDPRLIAAAPELLEMLIHATEWIEEQHGETHDLKFYKEVITKATQS